MNMMREKITIGTINERMKNIERVKKKKKIYERMMILGFGQFIYFNFDFPPDLPEARSFCVGP